MQDSQGEEDLLASYGGTTLPSAHPQQQAHCRPHTAGHSRGQGADTNNATGTANVRNQ